MRFSYCNLLNILMSTSFPIGNQNILNNENNIRTTLILEILVTPRNLTSLSLYSLPYLALPDT